MKVCHLSSIHGPYDARIFHREAASLRDAGYDVVIITPGESNAVENGITVKCVSRPRSRARRWGVTILEILTRARLEEARIYHLHDPELLLIAPLLRSRGARVIFDAHENLPKQIHSKLWLPRLLRPLASRLAQLCLRVAIRFVDGIVAATPEIADSFRHRECITARNFPLRSEADARQHSPAYGHGQLIYVGGISRLRGLEQMLELAKRTGPSGTPLTLLGGFDSLETEVAARNHEGWAHVQYGGFLMRDQVLAQIRGSVAGLVLLHPAPNYLESYPVKMFEYMAMGVPVIASDFPLWRSIVETYGCGLLVNPVDDDAIESAVKWMLNHPAEAIEMGERGRTSIESELNWEHEVLELLALYRRLEN